MEKPINPSNAKTDTTAALARQGAVKILRSETVEGENTNNKMGWEIINKNATMEIWR
ncbi:MAG TPA: hypothetical protein PKV95_08715 [Anaerolineaceae bacterium]|nr:hypothetical protein [Anaerolineaceae bacterium]HOH20117.1 hypothetical protein [Anaerolineaceae bacterium]HQL39545.1 hypothetical protein [Anaerolineaceae bacterium]